MAARLGIRLGKWLYQKGQIEESQIDVIRYAFEIMCSEFTEILVIVIFGITTNQVLETVLYLIFFQILRQFFQGCHAKTIFRCFVLTTGSYLVSLIIYTYVDLFFIVLSIIIGSILQLEYCYKKKEVSPILVKSLLWVASIIAYIIIPYVKALQILAVVELVVSISLIPERRNYNEK